VPATAAERRMLLAIVAGAAAIRIAFASESLWYDEISAFLSFAIEGPAVAFGSYTVPTNHVPMTLAMWAAFELTGSLSELALRAPAIAAGIATVPAAYALGATLLGRRAGLVMALSAAVAPIPVVESVEARGYAFVVLASTLAAFFLARGARTGAMRDFLGLALALAFAAWSHPVAILLAVSVGVVGLARDRRLAIAALLAGVIAAILLSPLVGDILATRASYARVSGDQPAVFSREGLEALAGLTLSWSVVPANPWDAVLPNPLLAAVAAVGGIALARGGAPRLRRARAAALPFAMAFAGAFALALAAGTWIYARFLLFAVPLSLLALALGARRMRFGVALIVAGSALSLPFLLTKQPIREAVAFVAAKRSAEDRVATIGLPDNAVGFYAEQYGFTARATGFLGDELRTVLEEDRPKFVIALYPDRIDPEILRLLDEGHDRTQRLEGWADWGAGAVEVWTASR
jgi:Dolichyl-phosphate-mannose-protein mannosyltransferase